MIDFALTEDQQMMQTAARQLAVSTLAPHVRRHEEDRAVGKEASEAAFEMGLARVALPEAAGGHAQGLVTAAIIEEELGAVDAGAALGLPGPHALAWAALELGTEAQAAELLAGFWGEDGASAYGAVAFSEAKANPDRPGMSVTATRDGERFVLRGDKVFVHNAPLAKAFVVIAQVDGDAGYDGLGAFAVRAEEKGVVRGERHTTVGLDAASFGKVSFDGVVLPPSARLARPDEPLKQGLLRFFAKVGLLHAARSVGVARSAYELAREYCETRTAFGKPIGHFQAVAFTLADRLMDVESSRWLVWRAACAWDAGEADAKALAKSAQAIAHAQEACMRCADDCVGLHGGSGFIRDVVAEKLMRDAKQLSLMGGTPESFDQLGAALAVGAPLDPALVLPVPETQAVFV